jgi:hypothetical protein
MISNLANFKKLTQEVTLTGSHPSKSQFLAVGTSGIYLSVWWSCICHRPWKRIVAAGFRCCVGGEGINDCRWWGKHMMQRRDAAATGARRSRWQGLRCCCCRPMLVWLNKKLLLLLTMESAIAVLGGAVRETRGMVAGLWMG